MPSSPLNCGLPPGTEHEPSWKLLGQRPHGASVPQLENRMDTAALASTMEGLENGHYAALPTPWRKIVFGLPLGHCEGDDHLKRLDLLLELREEIAAQAPPELLPIYKSLVKQAGDVRQVIAAFGRHPIAIIYWVVNPRPRKKSI